MSLGIVPNEKTFNDFQIDETGTLASRLTRPRRILDAPTEKLPDGGRRIVSAHSDLLWAVNSELIKTRNSFCKCGRLANCFFVLRVIRVGRPNSYSHGRTKQDKFLVVDLLKREL